MNELENLRRGERLRQGDLGRVYALERKTNRMDGDLSNMIGNFIEMKTRFERLEHMVKFLTARK